MNIAEASAGFLAQYRASQGPSEHTLRAYTFDLAALAQHVGPECSVQDLSRERIVTFFNSQLDRDLAASTVRRRACTVRALCRWLSAEGHIHRDPWGDFRLGIRPPHFLPRPVTASELRLLLRSLALRAGVSQANSTPSHSSAQLRDLTTLTSVVLLLTTGMRIGELVRVNVDDVDMSARTIKVMGKGSKERHVFLSGPSVTRLLTSYLSARKRFRPDHSILVINTSARPLSADAFRTRLSRAAVRAGIHRRITPHMLRHTAATQLIEAGVDIRYVQRLLGHRSLTTTEIYTEVADRSLRRTVARARVLDRLGAFG